MLTATTIDHAPPEIHHTGFTAGLGGELAWGFGEERNPEDLTGRAAWLVRHPGTPTPQREALRIGTGGWVYWPIPNALPRETPYVLLLEASPGGPVEVRARGLLRPALWVTP